MWIASLHFHSGECVQILATEQECKNAYDMWSEIMKDLVSEEYGHTDTLIEICGVLDDFERGKRQISFIVSAVKCFSIWSRG